jgi:hypothetical protein
MDTVTEPKPSGGEITSKMTPEQQEKWREFWKIIHQLAAKSS